MMLAGGQVQPECAAGMRRGAVGVGTAPGEAAAGLIRPTSGPR